MRRYQATCDDCPNWTETHPDETTAIRAGQRHGHLHAGELRDRDIDGFVRANTGLAHHWAHKAGHITGEAYDDLYADALIGLWDAAKRWDPTRGTFPTFAGQRIAGSIADGRRERDPLSRSQRRQGGYTAAVSLDAPIVDGSVSTFADLIADTVDPIADWHAWHDSTETHDRLTAAIATLPARQRHVVEGHLAGRTLKALGADLRVSECRASQLRHEAIHHLRRQMTAA